MTLGVGRKDYVLFTALYLYQGKMQTLLRREQIL